MSCKLEVYATGQITLLWFEGSGLVDRQRQTTLVIFALMQFAIAGYYYSRAYWVLPAACTFVGVIALAGIVFLRKRSGRVTSDQAQSTLQTRLPD